MYTLSLQSMRSCHADFEAWLWNSSRVYFPHISGFVTLKVQMPFPFGFSFFICTSIEHMFSLSVDSFVCILKWSKVFILFAMSSWDSSNTHSSRGNQKTEVTLGSMFKRQSCLKVEDNKGPNWICGVLIKYKLLKTKNKRLWY